MDKKDNRGALWPVKAAAGPVAFRGEEYYGQVTGTGAKSEKAPSSFLVLRSQGDRGKRYEAAMFRATGKKYIASGVMETPEGEYWVNLWPYEGNAEEPPMVNVTFQPKEPQQAPAAAPGYPPPDSEVPF